MKQIDLSTLCLAELLRIEKELPKHLNKARKTEKIELRKKMEALAAESGFNLEEIVGNKKSKQIGFVKAKYKNPDDSGQTWTGRGRKPKWAEKHLKNGGTLEELLI